jgi:ubiquinone/menaquinone biosynthesis C-methylase UbiE
VLTILRLAAPKDGETLLDLPSAGGFLSVHLETPNVRLLAVDPSPEMHALCKKLVPESYLAPLDHLPFADNTVDVAVCLAGLHHEPHPRKVFTEIRRVLRPGGRLAIAEVEEGSQVAAFLNGFVHRHNLLGHVGAFVNPLFVDELKASGFQIAVDRQANYHWPFESPAALGDCLRLMFGIDLATPAEIVEAVQSDLGIDTLSGGRIGMRWSLRTILALRD